MRKQYIGDTDTVRSTILAGVEKLKNAVAPTLGPLGSLVLIDRLTFFGNATKDGATIAKEIESEDPLENNAIRVCSEISKRTEEEAGDGTTSSIIVAETLLRAGFDVMEEEDMPFHQFKQELEIAAENSISYLRKESKKELSDEDLRNILMVSSNADTELSDMILDILARTNRFGSIVVDESRGLQTTYEVVPGYSYEKGPLSPFFYTDPQREVVEYDETAVLVCKGRLDNITKTASIMSYCAGLQLPLLIVAEELSPELLTMLVVNKMQKGLKFVATQVPHHGERHWPIFDDVSIITGATTVNPDTQEYMAHEHLGRASKIRIGKRRTVILSAGDREEVKQAHINDLEEKIKKESSQYLRDILVQRLAKLKGGVGSIKIGAPTELEMRERRDRAVDAHLAVMAALEEGTSPGAGYSLYRAALTLDGFTAGGTVLKEALCSIVETLADNSNMKSYDKEIRKGNLYNIRTQQYEPAFSSAVQDPTKVLINIIKNSVSIANILLNVHGAVILKDSDKERRSISDED